MFESSKIESSLNLGREEFFFVENKRSDKIILYIEDEEILGQLFERVVSS